MLLFLVQAAELNQLVSAQWKSLPPEEKRFFEDQAAADLARFEQENAEYQRMLSIFEKEEKRRAKAGKKKDSTKKAHTAKQVGTPAAMDTQMMKSICHIY